MRSDSGWSGGYSGRVGLFAVFQRSLAGKFSLMFLALLIPLAVVGFTISRGLTANAQALLQARHLKELSVRSFALILTQDDVTKEILLDPERITEAPRKIEAYDRNREILHKIAQLTGDAEMIRIVNELIQLDDDKLRPLDSQVIEASIVRGPRAAQAIYFSQYEPVRLDYLRLGRELTDRAEQVAVEAELELARKNRGSVSNVVVALGIGIALVAAVMTLITRDIQRRLKSVMNTLEGVSQRDLRPVKLFDSPDEIGRIASALTRAISEMGSSLHRVSDTSNEVETQVVAISKASSLVARVASKQGEEVAQASQAMETATDHVWGIAESARVLRSMVDKAHATIDSIAAMGEGFRQRSGVLNTRISETAGSVSEMGASMDQVMASIEMLAEAAHETSSSANQMATSMSSVDEAATSSEALANKMVTRGESGLAKVQQTIAGIEEVRRTTADAERVVKSLGARAGEIGSILDVINTVADETKLLALNAAIIAAQSGESGNAFSVVASEIRSLAQRVTIHTREIESLIGSVQDESENAIQAIGRGSESVASAVEMSGQAGEVVEEMMQSSQENAVQLGEIAGAVREQNNAAERVVELMSHTDCAVEEIREALKRQGSGNQSVLESTEIMRRAADEMSASTEEQADSLKRIAESVEGIRKAVEDVEKALDEQTRSTLSVAEFLEKVGSRSSENTRSAELTSGATAELQQLVESLRKEVMHFRLS